MTGTLNRRDFVAATLAAAAVPARAADADIDAPATLASLARAKGMQFGSALGLGRPGTPEGGFADAAYRALIVRECALIVPENEMKWAAVHPAADRFDFGPADRLVAWAGERGLGVRGHNLLWQNARWTPAWLAAHDFGADPRAAGKAMLRDHVARVAGRYAGAVRSFDVVNEAVDDATGALRETALSRAIGGTLDTVALAFHAARAAAPGAQLVYNDYMGWDAWSAAHRAGVLRLLGALKARGVPVDALGIQAHLGSGAGRGAAAAIDRRTGEWRRFLDEVAGMGLAMLVTELDVDDRGLPTDIAARDRAVADIARAFLDPTLSYRQIDTLMCWGLCDRYSWLRRTSARADGTPGRPLPFDAAMMPKPMRAALAGALRAMPARAAAAPPKGSAVRASGDPSRVAGMSRARQDAAAGDAPPSRSKARST